MEITSKDLKEAQKMTRDEFVRSLGKPTFGEGRQHGYVIDGKWYSEEQFKKLKKDIKLRSIRKPDA